MMHPDRRAWAQMSREYDSSYSDSSSGSSSSEDPSSNDEQLSKRRITSLDEEPLAKGRIKRNKGLGCTASNIVPEGSRSEPFQSMMEESFNNVILSDVTIYIKGLRLPAHSFVLAAQCSFFKDALTKGGLKKEAVKEFRYDTGQPHAYWRMSEYLYKGTYSVEPATEITEPDDDPIYRHIRVYAVAEAFGVEGLQRLATDRFKQSIMKQNLDTRFVECIRLVFTTTKMRDSMMRKEMMEIVGRHSKALWEVGAFRHLVRGGRDFAVEFAAKLLEG